MGDRLVAPGLRAIGLAAAIATVAFGAVCSAHASPLSPEGGAVSSADADLFSAMITRSRAVKTAARSLLTCDVDRNCRPARAAAAGATIRRESRALELLLPQASSACVLDAVADVLDSMRALARYADALGAGNYLLGDQALAESERIGGRGYSKLGRCESVQQGMGDRIVLFAYGELLSSVEGPYGAMVNCDDRFACWKRRGPAVQRAADRALRALAPLIAGAKGCVKHQLEKGAELLRDLGATGAAAAAGNMPATVKAAQRVESTFNELAALAPC